MQDFELNIKHRGEIKNFHGTFNKYGFSYRFTVNVDGTDVIFEPDEERNLRAIVPTAMQDHSKMKELIPLIAEELQRKLM
jgi:hypothetical protein